MGDLQKVQNKLFGSPAQSMEQREGKERERRQNRSCEEGSRMPRGCENVEGLAEYTGYKVKTGERAIYKALLVWASKGDGVEYTASFFGRSQVEPVN